MDWQEIYRQRLTTPAEAMKAVRSGDTVMIPIFPPVTLALALAARREELKDVMVRLLAPAADPGWLRMPDESTFKVEFELYIGDFARFVMDERRGTYLPNLFSLGMKAYDDGRHDDVRVPDVLICTVSKPNRAGYCHFGVHNWVQRSYARRCPIVIAQVDESLTQVHGDVYIHVSEIDQFVEFTPPPLERPAFDEIIGTIADESRREGWRQLANELPALHVLSSVRAIIPALAPADVRSLLGMGDPPPEAEPIAKHLHGLIQDGDTIQIGVGEPSRGMVRLGAFAGRKHLGIHTELGWPGLAKMWRDGIVDGSQKEIHTGKSVAAAWTGCDPTDLALRAVRSGVRAAFPHAHEVRSFRRDQQRDHGGFDGTDQLGDRVRWSHDQRHGRAAGDAYGRRILTARAGDHAAAVDSDGGRRLAHRDANGPGFVRHDTAILRRCGDHRVRCRAALGEEPSAARRRTDRRRASGSPRRSARSGAGAVVAVSGG